MIRIQRRSLMATAAALAFARSAAAEGSAEPIRIGWLASLTGPASAPAVGFDRGVQFATKAINGRRRRQGTHARNRHP